MKRLPILFAVIFSGILLFPTSFQIFYSIKKGVPFQPLDMVTDIVKTPIVRESKLRQSSDSLYKAWRSVSSLKEYNAIELEPVTDAFNFLKASYLNINSYTLADSLSVSYCDLKKIESLLTDLEDDPSERDSLDFLIQKVQKTYSSFSVKRLAKYYWRNGFLTSRYWRPYETRLEEENKIVQMSRPLIQNLFWLVFDEPGEKAFLGEDGNLFYKDDVSYLTMPSVIEEPVNEIVAFQQDLQKRGIELLVVIVPGKPSIYPELLNSSWKNASEKPFSRSLTALDQLKSKGVHIVDLFSPFIEAKKEDGDHDYLYLETDTHWTPRGAKLAAQLIANKVRSMPIASSLPTKFYKEEPLLTERTGDVAVMTSLPVFPTQWVNAYQVKDSNDILFKDDFRGSSILILGDSFSRIYQSDAPLSAGWISHLAKELNTPLASVVSDGGASTLVREKLARRSGVLKGKKLVIWEFVERDLRFGAEGWKRVPL